MIAAAGAHRPLLTLVRHAHAEWPDYAGKDFDRPLTQRGMEDALTSAREILAAQLPPDLLLSSTARRARDTAQILAREFGLATGALRFTDRLYNATADTLEAAAQDAGGRSGHIMMVAHNPGISDFARRLTGNSTLALLPTAGWVTGRL
ncbi:MAG: histidine phosphatase family protein [Pseudomonadota bacterium]